MEDSQKVVEIWNDVFMTYHQENGEVTKELPQKNIDTGGGFERLLCILQNKQTVQETDVLKPIADVAMKWAKN
jgi:alanyl-tRNA synthetase